MTPTIARRATRRLWAGALCLAGLSSPHAHAEWPMHGQLHAPGTTYRVRPGDTLWELSRKYMDTPLRWPELQRHNPVPVPERMRVGQLLVLGSSAAVLHAAGSVLRRRADGPEQPVATGALLEPGDLLVTGRDGFLTVGFADGSRVVLPSSSSARLVEAHGRQTRLELLNGRIESYVETQKGRAFEIRTRTFALGVKGTHFRARSEAGVQTVEVLEGQVLATELDGSRRSVDVAALEGAALHRDAGDRLEARRLLPPPTQRMPRDKNTVEAQAVEGASSYRLQLASDPGFLRMAAESRAPAPRFALHQDALAPGFYHTRVSAIDGQGLEGRSSEGVVFVAPPVAPMESTASPAGQGHWEIRWTTRRGQRHTFELASTPDFASPLVVQSGTYASGVAVGALEAPGRYYWRCREEAEEGESSLSPAEWGGSFEIPPP